jgi:proline iminopeptidase
MRTILIVAILASACGTGPRSGADAAKTAVPREARVAVGNAELYTREVGKGQPVIVLHGGPDFDQSYLLPEMDRLSDSFRLIYYDQRGRGKSAAGVRPEDVTLDSEMSDLEQVMRHFQLGSAVLLGHSWGTVLAVEYALRHPDRVSHLILMNPAPASRDDYLKFRKARMEQLGEKFEQMKAIASSPGYQAGDPDAVAAYYRIHFSAAFARPEDFETVVARMRASFTKEGVLKARAIEDRLMTYTWASPNGYDLYPKLATLAIPTLVIYGDHEFIPAADAATPLARAIPKARYVTMKNCGHFAYLECAEATRGDRRLLPGFEEVIG